MYSRTINSDLWLYIISFGQGYIDNHIVSTKFATDISMLLLYSIILFHPITGSILVTTFRFNFYLFPFILIRYISIRSTHILFHGIFSASLAGNLSYYLFYNFVHLQVSQLLPSFRMAFLITGQYYSWQIITSVLSMSG